MSRRLPSGTPPLTAGRMEELRAGPAAPGLATPHDETAAHHRQATVAYGGGPTELIVSDTGSGIPAGLGLAYARRLVTLLGGGLTVASGPGRGGVSTVTLPVRNGA